MDYPIEVTIELTSITEDIDAQLYFDLLGFGEADALVVIESVTIDDGTLGPGISVTPTDGLITSESGQTAEFTVVLLAPPTDDVTIRMFSTNHREATVSHDSVTFSSDN